MTKEGCFKKAKNRQSYCCIRAPELEKEKGIEHGEAFVEANKEWKQLKPKSIYIS